MNFPTLLPTPAQPFLLKSPRNGAANPSLGDVCHHVPLTPTEIFSLSLFLLSGYLRALPSLPCQPRISLGVLISLMFLLPAFSWLYCLAALLLLMSLNPGTQNWCRGLCTAKHCNRIRSCFLLTPLLPVLSSTSLIRQVRPFPVHLLSLLFQPPFPLLFASIITEVHPVYFRLSLSICLRLNDLHSFSPPAAQETARQMINATQTLPGLGTRNNASLDSVGHHPKSHQP